MCCNWMSVAVLIFTPQMRLEGQVEEKSLRLKELLDWLTKVEQALGGEQPLSEQSQPLTKQYSQHKVGASSLKGKSEIAFAALWGIDRNSYLKVS